ncbi:TonB-dependent siderophore receptor [Ancylomarina euxinus]|uniref:TonB-dependent siderophore receptor n=1 Tax=Ancylomarina euxinus TaxID=2283627 RepID=A0A425Y406_9BACT|nr:TonB-dependent receptor [Ancylomarina euxinus]MCZ4694611.1 TonB-dependent receptor [Ancylomarina euxinus]MUP14154.1 TonB-dependent siderophore receptor [Ancylomarina euxinus]RRG23010.1 TonB-dependent siderophore receptor [Ancylomarina euxinus]
MQRMNYVLFGLFMLVSQSLLAQSLTISGLVKEQGSPQPLIGANVYIDGTNLGAATNQNGEFSITNLKVGEYEISVSYSGYTKINKIVKISRDMPRLIFEMENQQTLLKGTNVSAQRIRQAESSLKLAAPLKDIPLTTSSVDRDLLDQLQVNNVNDALKYATGIKPKMNYGGFQTFSMRGFGAPVIMLDGARDERMNLSNSAPLTSLAAVERIEFVKGPASVLYGHSAVGGILNVVRKQPTKYFRGNFTASYGSWEAKRMTLGLGNRITDKLSYRFDASLSSQEGWRDNGNKTANAYLALDYEIDDKNKLEFRMGANDDFYGTETGLPSVKYDIYDADDKLVYQKGDLPENFDRKQRYNDPEDFLKHENVNASVKYTHEFNDESKLQFHSTYSDDLIDYFSTEELSYLTSISDIYANYYMKGSEKMFISLDTIQRTFPLRFSHETQTYQNDIDYSSSFKTGVIKHKYTAGYYFMYLDRTCFKGYNVGVDVKGDGLFAKVAVENPTLNQGNLSTSFSGASLYREYVNGFYFQDLIEVSEKVKFLAGLRFDHFKVNMRSAKVDLGRHLTDKSEETSMVNKSFSYRLGGVYQPIESLSVYASYSSFFKPKRSSFNANYVYLNKDGKEFFPEDGKEVYEPENGYQFEAGIKYDYKSFLNLNASAYYIKKNNIVQSLGKTDDGRRVYGQIGMVDSKGFDIEALLRPTEGLSITTGYGFNIAKYRQFSANDYINSTAGNDLTFNPRNQVYAWAFYQVQKGTLKSFNMGLGANYSDKMFTDSNNEYELDGYCLFDAALGYMFDKTFVKLKINNILNKEYESSSVYSNQYVPGQERNFVLTVGLKL